MCRWHGLIDQSLHSRLGVETTNGDGFGLGWYGTGDGPGLYRSTSPAWGDANLRHHPFNHGRWLFVHNGVVNGFGTLRRECALGLVEQIAARHGIGHALQASIGVSDGERLWAVRYATDATPRTLFHSGDVEAVQAVHADDARLQRMREGDVLVVSEPFSDLPGAWVEIPVSSALVIGPGGTIEHRAFRPTAP